MLDKMPKYSFMYRLKYTAKRNWFCKTRFLWFNIPCIATNQDIFIDWIWRDLLVDNIKRAKISAK